MIKTYLTCERYLENYNKGEKTVVGRLDTPKHVCVTETDMSQETVFYNSVGMKIPRHVDHYLVGPIAETLHAYEELGYTPEELKKIIEKYEELKRRTLCISTATSSIYGSLGSPFEKKFREIREEIEQRRRIEEIIKLEKPFDPIESLYPKTMIASPALERREQMNNKQFTKKDLKPGYVVKLRNGMLELVTMSGACGTANPRMISVSDKGGWTDITNDIPNDLRSSDAPINSEYDIVEVYGYSKFANKALKVSTEDRDLLWKREEKTCDNCAHKVVCTHVGMCEHYMEKEASK